MLAYLKQQINKFNDTKTYLVITNLFLVCFLILFNNLGVLPMRTGDFVFFAFLVLALALYRPGWAFMFFVGTIALENINLAPESLGIILRPYQFIGGLLFLAIAIKFLTKKLYFKLVQPNWLDYLVFLIPLAGLLNIINSQNVLAGIKFALILSSFAILFLLTRNYIQNTVDLKKSLPFFLGSSLVIMLYGFWQNNRFTHKLNSFAVMPGRPNSTLTEPDWLGLYLILILTSLFALIYFFIQKGDEENQLKKQTSLAVIYVYLILAFTLLIISVARSAWLGAIAMTILFLIAIFYGWQWKVIIKIKLGIISAFFISLGIVYFFQLTTFQLFDRAVSTGGLQKITISCQNNIALPEKILALEELNIFNCRQINLEEIETEKKQGRFVTEIKRDDPNVSVRAEVYRKSWLQIKAHPILGIGWENIATVLGKDARGINLNSSNIFLETYLGSGIMGFVSLIIIFITIFVRAIIAFYREVDLEQKTFALFVLISWTGIIVFNLFNAGIMLGFFWVWLGIVSGLKIEKLRL